MLPDGVVGASPLAGPARPGLPGSATAGGTSE